MPGYTVGYTIHEAHNLVSVQGGIFDPLVVVRCCGREYSTDVKRHKAGLVNFEESRIESNIHLTEREWESAFIEFEIQVANAFTRNEIIGSCSLELGLVRARKRHQVKSTYPIISKNETETKGYLSVTVYALAEGDIPPNPNQKDSDDEDNKLSDDLTKAVLNIDTPKVKTGKQYHLYISIHRVEDLSKCIKGDRDPFVTCSFAGNSLKSSQARATCNHTYNECFRLPVSTPIAEDTILIRLVDWNFMSGDELLAQGRLSFAQLRSKPITARWYVFYGFDKNEISDLGSLRVAADSLPQPNKYLGRMLISARVEKLDKSQSLLSAAIVASKAMEEPQVGPTSILTDVYEVCGSSYEEVSVEVSYGPESKRTSWTTGKIIESQSKEKTKVYPFEQTPGRIDTIQLSTPIVVNQAWDIILSVYGKTTLGEERIAYQKMGLDSIPVNQPGNARTPLWIPLHNIKPQQQPSSVLIIIEKALVDDVIRSKRKFVATREYDVRCYIYACRNLICPLMPQEMAPTAAVSVNCAGSLATSYSTNATAFPVFLDCLRLPCRFAADPTLNLPTVSPITLNVFSNIQGHHQLLIGSAICRYDRVRVGGVDGNIALKPKWIKLKSDKKNVTDCGDILVAFEIVSKKNSVRLPPQPLIPNLRLCSLTISLLGIRDLLLYRPSKSLFNQVFSTFKGDLLTYLEESQVKKPIIVISLPSYGQDSRLAVDTVIPWSSVQATDPMSVLCNKSWTYKKGRLSSFDFCVAVPLEIAVPDDPIFDPYIVLRIYDKTIANKKFVGEAYIRLTPLLPWVQNVAWTIASLEAEKDFTETVDLAKISRGLKDVQEKLKLSSGHSTNLGLSTIAEADEEYLRTTENSHNKIKNELMALIQDSTEISGNNSKILPNGEPRILVQAYAERMKYEMTDITLSANMFSMNVFIPGRFVLAVEGSKYRKQKGQAFDRPAVDDDLENYLDDICFNKLNIIRRFYAFNQLHTKLPGELRITTAIEYKGVLRHEVADDFAKYIFNEEKLRKKFRVDSPYPNTVKLRLYVIRAIGLHIPAGKPLNPFLTFRAGNTVENLRSAATTSSSPEFYVVHEAGIQFPQEGRITISVMSKVSDFGNENDFLIGETTVDLEERWFCKSWQKLLRKNQIPIEYRPLRLHNDSSAINGILELWIELVAPQDVQKIPRYILKPPEPAEVELRLIIWGARSLSFEVLNNQSHIDALVSVNIDCSQYKGEYNVTQDTDVHYHSTTGNCLYNWRIVYPKIQTPISACVVQIAVYQFQPLGASTFIGEVNVDLNKHLTRVAETLTAAEYDAELALFSRESKSKCAGFVQVTVQMIPQLEATLKKGGLGRQAPNSNPKLTTPVEGRKWEDFMYAAGARTDFSKAWFMVSYIFVIYLDKNIHVYFFDDSDFYFIICLSSFVLAISFFYIFFDLNIKVTT